MQTNSRSITFERLCGFDFDDSVKSRVHFLVSRERILTGKEGQNSQKFLAGMVDLLSTCAEVGTAGQRPQKPS